ncbi:MAG: T9SS type A sorting domain-containing protein [Saprospiraceae bacterium]|nr:T9SS type A sorting domain-containing protein [Saprospiraceae bacterium]
MKNSIFFLFSFLTMAIYGQIEVPDFEFKIYITNPDGDKDSLCLGDVLRDKHEYADTAYGEYDVSHIPYRSSLDIRMTFLPNSNPEQKKFITRYNCDTMGPFLPPRGDPSQIPIGFYSRSYPVTLSWDKEKFHRDTCRDSSFITRIDYSTFDFFDERNLPKVEARLSTMNQLILDKDYLEQTNYAAWARRNYYETKLNNGDSGVIYMIHIGITNQPLRILIDTKNPQKQSSISLYPNPALDNIHILNSDGFFNSRQFDVFDFSGKKVRTVVSNTSIDNLNISVHDLPPGIYLIMPLDRTWLKTFVKE